MIINIITINFFNINRQWDILIFGTLIHDDMEKAQEVVEYVEIKWVWFGSMDLWYADNVLEKMQTWLASRNIDKII